MSRYQNEDDVEETEQEDLTEQSEEWMCLARLATPISTDECLCPIYIQQIEEMRSMY